MHPTVAMWIQVLLSPSMYPAVAMWIQVLDAFSIKKLKNKKQKTKGGTDARGRMLSTACYCNRKHFMLFERLIFFLMLLVFVLKYVMFSSVENMSGTSERLYFAFYVLVCLFDQLLSLSLIRLPVTTNIYPGTVAWAKVAFSRRGALMTNVKNSDCFPRFWISLSDLDTPGAADL